MTASIDTQLQFCAESLVEFFNSPAFKPEKLVSSNLKPVPSLKTIDFDKQSSDDIISILKANIDDAKKVEDSLIFEQKGFLYHYKKSRFGNLRFSKYEKPDFSNVPDKFLQPVSNDRTIVCNMLAELATLYPKKSFQKMKPDTEFSSTGFGIFSVSTRSNNTYFSKDMLELCNAFPEAFSKQELAFLDDIKNDSMNGDTTASDVALHVFTLWENMLRNGRHDKNNIYSFNDADNFAYYAETSTHVMIEQESQNTIYAYVKEKVTDHIQIWQTAKIVDTVSELFAEKLEESSSYIELMQLLNHDHGYLSYPCKLSGVGYPQSSAYFLENLPEDSEFLVFDSKRGFNVNSAYCSSLLEDFDILSTVY